jgi:hypothetical protein
MKMRVSRIEIDSNYISNILTYKRYRFSNNSNVKEVKSYLY